MLTHWPLWLCVDEPWSSTSPLDRPYDLQHTYRHRQCEARLSPSFIERSNLELIHLQYSIYQSSIDYTVAAYGVYAASATGGNDFARDFLAGIAALYSTPMFENIGPKYSYEYASTILACISVLVTTPIYFFYRKGPVIRERSPFAKKVMEQTRQRKLLQTAGRTEKQEPENGRSVSHVETVLA